MENAYQWVPFYEELANKLLVYSNKRDDLFALMKQVSSEQPLMKYLHFEREDWWGPRHHQIDPFSVIGVMNRRTTDMNRTVLAKVLASTLEVKLPVPTQFTGIPILDPRKSFFAGVDELWDLYVLAMKAADTNEFTAEFKTALEKAIAINGNGLANITMGLYWIRPNIFMPLDGNSRSFVSAHYGVIAPNGHCSGDEYVEFLGSLKTELAKQSPQLSFPEVSYLAWAEKNPSPQPDADITNTDTEDQQNATQNTIMLKNRISTKNLILCGTPGTGKTYSAIQYAVAIVEDKPLTDIKAEDYDIVFARYLKYKDDGLIAFTTFHQSFGYEEFIEGIRPVVVSDENTDTGRNIEYEIHDGIFKEFCDKAGTPVESGTNVDLGIGRNPRVWKVALFSNSDSNLKQYCFTHDCARLGKYDVDGQITDSTDFTGKGGQVVNTFHNKIKVGDIIVSPKNSKEIDGIGVVTGEASWLENDERGDIDDYHRSLPVKWLAINISVDVVKMNADKTLMPPAVTGLHITPNDIITILHDIKPQLFTQKTKIPNRVFIIDEINRGNISKIFGELITLIEPSKRIGAKEQLRAILPYSGKKFGVPDNVYIIGTMNTADRSIAMIDTALRRRFDFIEMQPDSTTLKDVFVDGIDVAEMLDTLNKRITVLFDREHTLGHSYLLPLKSDPSIECLAGIFKNRIIPLLQEYFYDDYEKIQLVLGDNQKPDDSTRFIVKKADAVKLFGNAGIDFPEYYEINNKAFKEIDAYAFL